MKQKLFIALLLFVLSSNVVACVNEESILPPTTDESTSPTPPNSDNDSNDDNNNGNQTDSMPRVNIIIGNKIMVVRLYDNQAARDFASRLPLTVTMNDMNGNEKYCDLPQSLPTSVTRPGTIRNGDLMLYGSRTLVLFYETFSSSYSYTRIGKIDNISGFKAALGTGSVTIKFELE